MSQSTTQPIKVSVTARFSSSRAFSTPQSSIPKLQFDEFHIDPLPSEANRQDGVLTYEFEYRPIGGPAFAQIDLAQVSETEARMFLATFSLVAASNITFQGTLVNGEDTATRIQRYTFSNQPPINFEQVKDYYNKLGQLRLKDRERYVNAARAYQSAVSLLGSNPTVSFFLLVVAIECLSNYVLQAVRKEKKRERFARFVETYLPESMNSEKSDLPKFKNRLETAYRLRNSFVHGGQPLPPTVSTADGLARPSVLYFERKKERRAPGLVWLERIVRATLLGFLEKRIVEMPNKPRRPLFRKLPSRLRVARLRIKAGHSVQKWQPITFDMLDLD
jgi:hypothetical protein